MPLQILAASILFLIGSLMLFAAHLAERRRRRETGRRIGLVAAPLLSAGSPSAAQTGKAGEYVKFFFTFGAGYSWGMHASALQLALAASVSAVPAGFVAWRGLGLPGWLAVFAAAGGSFLGPRIVLQRQRERAQRDFTNLLPDAIDMVVRVLRGGMPMTHAIQIASNEAPPPVNSAFATITDQIRIGVPLAEALDAASTQIALPDFRFFAVAAIMQYATGGNLIATLEDLSQIMRKRQAARLKARAVSAEIRFSANVLGALPLVVAGALFVIEPGFLAPLFRDRRGHYILAAAGGGLVLSFLAMRQMMRSVGRE